MSLKYNPKDHTAAFGTAFFIANLLFVGVFYIALWVLYFLRYQEAPTAAQNHLKQALVAASISTLIFICINLLIISTDGYASLTALLALETYYMLFVPLFLIVGILAFVKAVNNKTFKYPLIAKILKITDD